MDCMNPDDAMVLAVLITLAVWGGLDILIRIMRGVV